MRRLAAVDSSAVSVSLGCLATGAFSEALNSLGAAPKAGNSRWPTRIRYLNTAQYEKISLVPAFKSTRWIME